MFLILAAQQRVMNASDRTPCCIYDDIHVIACDHRVGVVGDEGRAAAQSFSPRTRRVTRFLPADALHGTACPCWRQVRNADQMNAGRTRCLGQIHRTKFTGANQPYSDGTPCLGTSFELRDKRHAVSFIHTVESRFDLVLQPETSRAPSSGKDMKPKISANFLQ